ncbi:hypothetical protein N9N28_17125 [Rubripirellula amarantea]|nr:hypothetical protein [Rubripirellula amarantea]
MDELWNELIELGEDKLKQTAVQKGRPVCVAAKAVRDVPHAPYLIVAYSTA